jgi:hypothetical protein
MTHHDIAWRLEHSVEADVPCAFAWEHMSNVANWNDPPATFELDGPFVDGARGTTRMPDQPPVSWTLRDVDPGRGYTIVGGEFLDGAHLIVRWQFAPVSDARAMLTQQMELSGPNAATHVDAIASGFGPNIEPGMKRLAELIEQAFTRKGRDALRGV